MSNVSNITSPVPVRLSVEIVHTFQLYYTPFLVLFGSLGNCISVLVFFSTKLRKLSSSYYLSALAVSDTGVLIFTFTSWLALFDVVIFNEHGLCQLSVYLMQVCSFLSVWFIVAFTVERFIAVRYPLKRPSMCTVTRAKVVLIGLSLLALLGNAPYIFISSVANVQDAEFAENKSELICSLSRELEDIGEIFNHIDLVVTLIVPFLTIVVLNTLISRTVCRVARVRRTMTKSSSQFARNLASTNSATIVGNMAAGTSNLVTTRTRTPSSQTKVTEMLLVVSTVFIILNLPSYVVRVWIYLTDTHNVGTEQKVTMYVLQQYCNILFNTNFGINFALYCISGQNFRRALLSLFRPEIQRRSGETTQTTVSEYCRTASTRRTVTVNGSWREAHEMVPINKA
ncbi:G-protein coupled receptor isoform X2 [Rhodnius prolixus]|uniref:G-protein coupled receptor isoform X2 n=1 Tax=Rhodnius prolixus TaxID=13249 RepID=UPI003D1886EC